MDVNGTRIQLVLGLDDWAQSVVQPPDHGVCFDRHLSTLGLRPRPFVFPTRRQAARLVPADRRGAGVDRYGNRFWIGPDRHSLWVLGAGHSQAFLWWPPPSTPEAAADGTFAPCQFPTLDELELSGLAVTADQYLVLGVLDLPVNGSVGGGLLVFDLAGGGPPVPLWWPLALGVLPFDLTAMPDGGVAVLDVADPSAPGTARLWHLDRNLRVLNLAGTPPPAAEALLFGPVDPATGDQDATAANGSCELRRATAGCAVTLDAAWPVAIEALADGSILVLDRYGPRQHFDVSRWRCGKRMPFEIRTADPDPTTAFTCTDQRANAAEVLAGTVGHDLVSVAASEAGGLARLFIVDDRGDQAFEFALDESGADLVTSYHPLRLFSGKALISDGSIASYDLADQWYPIPTLPVERYATDAMIVLAPIQRGGRGFDAGAPGTVWHRLVLDAAIPAGTTVMVETRTADDLNVLEQQRWRLEPTPYRRNAGSEIAYHDYRPPGTCPGQGSWELLLQSAVGRYLQLRLKLIGDGHRTPRLWAVRLHYPRFSYLEQYLPDIYREDRDSASFLDRYLANVEGMYTALEGRITHVQRLLDPKTIDAEYLPWLASWVGAVVQPDWEPARQRLLVRHAARMFTRRGTQRGLIEAIRLATHPCPSDAIFDPGSRLDRFDVRVVETFRTRSIPGVVFGDPNDAAGPRYTTSGARWQLTDGGSELQRRWRLFLAERYQTPGMGLSQAVAAAWGISVEAVGTPPSFPVLTPPLAAAARDWGQFVRGELAVTYADVGANDLGAYRAFLAERYRRIEDYRSAWTATATAGPVSFDAVEFPTQLPADGAPLQDWIKFVSSVLPLRRAAHRATVLVPIRFEDSDQARRQRLGRVRRVVDVERPAHTLVAVVPYWAAFRVGSARVGMETIVGEGSRYVDLVLGAGRLAHAAVPGGRTWRLEDRVVVGRDRIERSAAPAGTGGL